VLPLDFLAWWYGTGWLTIMRNAQKRLLKTARMFSLPILLRTLFAPWRRIITYPGASFDAHMRALFDNLVSRAVGFTVRIFVLIAAAVVLSVVGLVVFIEIIAWPLIPVAIVVALIKGLAG
jgi:hypothetical protein